MWRARPPGATPVRTPPPRAAGVRSDRLCRRDCSHSRAPSPDAPYALSAGGGTRCRRASWRHCVPWSRDPWRGSRPAPRTSLVSCASCMPAGACVPAARIPTWLAALALPARSAAPHARKTMSSAGRPAPWVCNPPRRLPSMRSSGLPAIGNPRAMPQPMPLYLAPKGGRARGASPTGPPQASPGRQHRRMCNSPRRPSSVRSSGLPAIGNPRAMPQPMPLHLTLEGGHARAPPGGPPRASPGC